MPARMDEIAPRQLAVVTGASSGIGYELAGLGEEVEGAPMLGIV
jgi:NADP-dependent 3-hydroxy acid dehydrogenase YdfG